MSFSSYTALIIVLLFVVPGFIIDSVLRRFIPLKNNNSESTYLRLLIFSCYHYGLYAIPIYYVFVSKLYNSSPTIIISSFLFIIFGSPLIIGFLIVIIRSKNYHEWFVKKFNVKPIKSISVAWDYFFSKTETIFATVYFKDATVVNGKFGASSYASSISSERDLYLECIYEVDENGNWEVKQGSQGMLIKAEEIKAVEFFEGGE